jgi:hypothetical protein
MFSYFSSAEGQKGMQQFLDGVTGIADAIAEAMKQFDKAKPLIDFLMWTTSVANAPLRFLGDVATNIATAASGGPGTTSGAATPGANNNAGSIVYNIYGVASGADVLKVIKGEASKKGRTVLGLLTNG